MPVAGTIVTGYRGGYVCATITRRALLHRLGRAGGLGAVFDALGLAGGVCHAAILPSGPITMGRNRHVIVLEAGITGLVCAYELERSGFEVTVLEARDRVGGRSWTLRDGDRVDLAGEELQRACYSDGIYMNAKSARILGQT